MNFKGIWRKSPEGRATLWTLAAIGFFLLIQMVFVLPCFERIAGFKPFNAQFPLSEVAVAIQLGAYGTGAARAYVLFIATEIPLALSTSVFFALLWHTMFLFSPNRIFMFLKSGGILFTPFIAVVFNVAESVGFARLIAGLSGPSYASVVELSTLMHQLRGASEDLRIYVTIFFAGVIVIQWVQRKSAEL